jgi:hypothetical protein
MNEQNQKPGGQQQDQQGQQRLQEQQQQRQGGGGRVDLSQLKEHMEVVGSDGAHVGTVDKVEGNRIKLTKRENSAGHGDHHHYIEASSVASIDGNKVRLSTGGGLAGQQEKSGQQVNKS